MPKSSEFVTHILDLGSAYGELTSKAMFGGHGIYHGDHILGMIVDDRLYLKVDDVNQPQFETVGSKPFAYHNKKTGEDVAMSYWEVPASAIDDGDDLAKWLESAEGAAVRSKGKKRAPAKEPRAKTPPAKKTKAPAPVEKTTKAPAAKKKKK